MQFIAVERGIHSEGNHDCNFVPGSRGLIGQLDHHAFRAALGERWKQVGDLHCAYAPGA
jgi:hypothetical protein